MIGATITCSRSRHPAAIKRDTVSAPPSIRMRRKPRSASAARMAAGIAPPGFERQHVSVDAGGIGGACLRRDHQAAHAVLGAACARRRKPPPGSITMRAGWAGDAPHRELRIVRDGRADPDHHGIDQRAQPVQIASPAGTVDVFVGAPVPWRSGHRSTGRSGRPLHQAHDGERQRQGAENLFCHGSGSAASLRQTSGTLGHQASSTRSACVD